MPLDREFRADSARAERARDRKYLRGSTDELSRVQPAYLDRVIELVARHGARLVLVATPIHPLYTPLLPAEVKGAFDRRLARVASDGEASVLDLRDLPLPADHYYDFDHVTPRGAAVVTERLSQVLMGSG